MKSHSIPSLLGIAAVLIAALVVAIAFGVATDSPTAQAQAADDDPNLINITTATQLDAVRYDEDANGEADSKGQQRPKITKPPSPRRTGRARRREPEHL